MAAAVPDGERAALADAAVRLLEAALPPDESVPTRSHTGWQLLVPHVDHLLRTAPGERSARLAVRVARQMHHAGDFAGALKSSRETGRIAARHLGAEHPVSLAARDAEAWATHFLTHYADAEVLHRRNLAARERVLGTDRPDTWWSCLGLGLSLSLLGRYEEAERTLRRAVDGQRRVLGEDALETLFSRSRLIQTLPHLGKWDEFKAEAQVVEDCERVLPPDHLTTVAARHGCAEGLRVFERFAEAEPIARRVLADRSRLQGSDHPLALAALNLTALVAYGLGKTGEAVALCEQLVERRERVLGAEHPFVLGNRERLARWRAEAAGGS
ncbi:tetratricopeptide repeat protein [Streptomyces sp. NPDC018031]|uniref:tetratricopeptide repeat protein n=1 Tax=Streptomyces sp. NPDC018031 TaxID=3365033 RepID=UPI0037A01231